ncbi:MAG TPA: phosphatase PAP2 family protein [Blastocatellia bacterium]|nr:phosphatase PAP2 family protein [Blastocatellia bacterium]
MNGLLSNSKRSVLALALTIFAIAGASAQTPKPSQQQTPPVTTPSPQSTTKPSPERQFVSNILRDQRAIWTSPLHLHPQDAWWLAPLTAGTVALLATDRFTTEEGLEFSSIGTNLRVSNDLSKLGSGYAAAGVSGAFYLVGRITDNPRARETGLLAGEALIDGAIVSTVIKAISQRPRPHSDSGRGDFLDGGNSFPSGHSMAVWAVATVIALEYRKHRWVPVTAYGIAALVSVSRFTGSHHFLSDVLVGSAIGFGTARYVYQSHHDPVLNP